MSEAFPTRCRCWVVTRDPQGVVTGGVSERPWTVAGSGPAATVAITVEAAGFNYKDALACVGHPGVMRTSPLVPGIDVAGRLLEPIDSLPVGTAVVATGHGLGEHLDGGFADVVRAPVEAVLPRPDSLTAAGAMALGTAGLTVVLASDRLAALVHDPSSAGGQVSGSGSGGHDERRDDEWLVTGASGGVGMIAVTHLARLGRRVVACTRKASAAKVLRELGATEVVAPEDIVAATDKSLARGRWAGVIDTVGGPLLAGVLRSVRPGGAVAAVGMAGGVRLDTTVHPFILRGITLAGIDAAGLPTRMERAALWRRLAELWPTLDGRLPVTQLALEEVGSWAERMLAGTSVGRAIVIPRSGRCSHAINLSDAWEPSDAREPAGGAEVVWTRRFGRPTGLGDDTRIWLVLERSASIATVTLNGTPLMRAAGPADDRAAPLRLEITGTLHPRNTLTLGAREIAGVDRANTIPSGHAARSGASGRRPLPPELGRVWLEIETGCDDRRPEAACEDAVA